MRARGNVNLGNVTSNAEIMEWSRKGTNIIIYVFREGKKKYIYIKDMKWNWRLYSRRVKIFEVRGPYLGKYAKEGFLLFKEKFCFGRLDRITSFGKDKNKVPFIWRYMKAHGVKAYIYSCIFHCGYSLEKNLFIYIVYASENILICTFVGSSPALTLSATVKFFEVRAILK